MNEENEKEGNESAQNQVEGQQQKAPNRFVLDFGSTIATLDTSTNMLTFVSPSGLFNGAAYIPASSFSIADDKNLILLSDMINRFYPRATNEGGCRGREYKLESLLKISREKLVDRENTIASQNATIASLASEIQELKK